MAAGRSDAALPGAPRFGRSPAPARNGARLPRKQAVPWSTRARARRRHAARDRAAGLPAGAPYRIAGLRRLGGRDRLSGRLRDPATDRGRRRRAARIRGRGARRSLGRRTGPAVVVHRRRGARRRQRGHPRVRPQARHGERRCRRPAPAAPRHVPPRQWAEAFEQAYEDFCAEVERGADTAIDPYGAEHPGEFFAVVSEVFFEAPLVLQARFPAVYDSSCTSTGWTPPPARRQAGG
jgi:hypothetical protein